MRADPRQSASIADLRFELLGERLPLDHGQALAEAVCGQLPWLADDIDVRVDEILGLEPDALLVHLTHSGTDRTGGGTSCGSVIAPTIVMAGSASPSRAAVATSARTA